MNPWTSIAVFGQSQVKYNFAARVVPPNICTKHHKWKAELNTINLLSKAPTKYYNLKLKMIKK